MTRQLRKHGVLAIALIVVFALVFACVGVAAINGNSKAALAQGETVTFQVAVSGDAIRYVGDADLNHSTVVVTYKMTQNDGFNSMLLIPTYDTSVFSIASNSDIVISDVLGNPTITSDGSNASKKILIEKDGPAYKGTDASESFFLTITYTIKGLPADGDEEYAFGLDLVLDDGDTDGNSRSAAYFIQGGEQKGDQNEVAIVFTSASVRLITLEKPVITIGYNRSDGSFDSGAITKYYLYEFGKAVVETADVASMSISHEGHNMYEALEPSDPAGFKVYYTFESNDVDLSDVQGAPSVSESWFYYDDQSGWVAMPNNDAPVLPGTYKVTLSSPAQTKYQAAQASAIVYIVPRTLNVIVPNKSSAYGDPLAELTPQGPAGGVCSGDTVYISLNTDATPTSAVGNYNIVGSVNTSLSSGYSINNPYGSNELYNVVFYMNNSDEELVPGNAIYTITGKELILTAEPDQEASYTGSEPTVDQTKYTLKDADGNSYASLVDGTLVKVSIAKEAGVNKGNYKLTPSISGLNEAYTVSTVKGTFTITAADVAKAHFTPFFEGLTKTYNRNQQDLLKVNTKDKSESWWSYTVLNNLQTNVDEYLITITVTVDSNHHYTGEDNPIQLTVYGKIEPEDITITAGNVAKLYGEEAGTPAITVSDPDAASELNYSYAIKNGSNETIVPAANTPVGAYSIVLSESNNSNYNVTLVNGTYTVSKATASVTLTANSVYYNRPLSNTASASVNTIALNPTLTFYAGDDVACEHPLASAPVNAGSYKVMASVADTDNYNGAEQVVSFEIFKVKLEGVIFTYSHGNATWTAVANDIGKTADEAGVAAAALNDCTVSYEVYNGNSKVADIAAGAARSFDAAAATTYSVKAIPSNDNYLPSETAMVAAFEVSFAKGTPNPDGAISNLPDTQFVFNGQTAIAPQTNPSVPHNVFNKWQLNSADYNFESAVNSNIELVALWNAQTYTVTLKYLSTSETTSGANQDVFVISNLLYGATVDYSSLGIAPVKSSGNPGINYVFDDKWADESSVEYGVENDVIQNYTVSGDMTFVAVFRETYNSFTVSYWFTLKTDATGYGDAAAFERSFAYGEAIDYSNNLQAIAWFVKDGWYADPERTVDAPVTMPNANIDVYMGLKFDIGKGDVNGDGLVNADDITLYRKWIVGGYEMEVINAGDEWATASDEQFDSSKTYFLKGVADGNLDNSRDIRDVSIIRMAVAGGYNWEIFNSEEVSGDSLARIKTANSIANLLANLNGNHRTILFGEGNEAFTDGSLDLSFSGSTHIYIDLDGHNLTVKSLNITSSGRNAVVTIKNGKIYSMGGITISAPRGTVILDNVIGYVNNNPVNLQAASHSLHFANVVEFYDLYAAQPTVAPIHVEENTHVVVEAAAQIKIEKIIVTENSFQQVAEQSEAAISLLNKTETAIAVEDNRVVRSVGVACIGDKVFASLDAAAAAAQPGDTVVLLQDITYGEDRSVALFDPGFALDLNGHTVTTNSTVDVTLSNNGYKATAICFATEDASSLSNGTIVTAYGAGLYAAATTCTLDNVTINANTLDVQATSEYSSAIRITSAGTVIINSGSYTGYNAIAVSNSGGVFVINGGTFNGRIFFSTGTNSGVTKSITINGGTFNGEFVNPNKGTLVIRGGSFDHDPTAYLADGFAASYSNGIWTVGEAVARIGDNVFASFDAAVAAAQNGDTVVLLQNITYGEDRSVPVWTSKVFNIDLNGYTFTTNSNVGTTLGNNGYTASAICFSNANAGSNLTISNGTIVTAYGAGVYADDPGMAITFEDLTINAAQVGTQSTAEYSAAIRLTGEATAIIESGSYSGAYALAVSNSGGIVVINGGTFNGGIFFSTGTTSGKTKSITINGGTFNGEFVNPNKGTLVIRGGSFDHDPTAYLAEGCDAIENNGIWTVGEYGAARIGNQGYDDLVSAIQAINANGGTLTLTNDLDFSDELYAGYKWAGSIYNPLEITHDNVTLDLNGHTISNMGNAALCAGNLLAANGRISNFTIKNGTLSVGQTDGVNNSYALLIAGVDGALIKNVTTFGGINVCTGSEDVVIENCTVQGTKYYTVCAQTGSHVIIRGTTYTKNTDSTVANKSMFWIQGADKDSDMVTSNNPMGAFGASSITIESGNFNVDTSNGGVFYLSSGTKPIVKGGSYNIDPTAYLADGFAASYSNGIWTVSAAE